MNVGAATSGTQEVEAHTSLARGKHPPAGFQGAPFLWRNLTDGPPPRRRGRGQGTHATYHSTEVGEYVRIGYSTLVGVGRSGNVIVDERVSVQKRVGLELIDRERAFTDKIAYASRARLAQSLVRQRRAVNALPAWALRVAIGLIRAEARSGIWLIHVMRTFFHSLVQVPDRLITRLLMVEAHLSTRYGRRAVIGGLRNPSSLGNEQKGVVLFLSAAIFVATVLLLNSIFALVLTQHAPIYRRILGDMGATLLGVLVLPLAIEVLALASFLRIGFVWGGVGIFAGKMVGVWLLYFVGDSLHEALRTQTTSRPRLARAVVWIHHHAEKRGFGLLVAINAFPFVTDVLLYAFAVSGMRYRAYMGGIALGTAIKLASIGFAIWFMGPEAVLEFLRHPIETVRGT